MAKSTFFWILSASLDFVLAPGTAILQLNVRDLGTLLPKLKAGWVHSDINWCRT